jgi:CheY-like chemotaxis protein
MNKAKEESKAGNEGSGRGMSSLSELQIESQSQEEVQFSLRDFNLLIVNDDPFQVNCIINLALKMGIPMANLKTAFDGQEAVKAFKERPSFFDLVLMDLNMPKLDGFGAAKQIRAHFKQLVQRASCREELLPLDRLIQCGGPPIISVSSNLLTEDMISDIYVAGMNGSLMTPVSQKDLEKVVQTWGKKLADPTMGGVKFYFPEAEFD